MPEPEHPQLRPYLTAEPEDASGQRWLLCDRLRLSDTMVRISRSELEWIQLLNGKTSLQKIQSIHEAADGTLPLARMQKLVLDLESIGFLEGPHFRALVDAPVRRPSCIGCYSADPTVLRQQLERLFTAPGGPGMPGPTRTDEPLRALLVPHMDYARGNVTYGWGFKELAERCAASLFVIVGTSHYSTHRFTLTRKNFSSPLGIVETDQKFIDRLVAEYGDGLFDDEWLAHFPEHSIELEVVLLQYLLEGKRPIRIVPLVVGSFGDWIRKKRQPTTTGDIGRMIAALRAALRATDEPICCIISGDLAHIGPKFGDNDLSSSRLEHSKSQDEGLLKHVGSANAAGYFDFLAAEGDERRICGLPPTYTVLQALQPKRGKVLHYGRFVHPKGYESVSFASAAFA